MNTASISSTSSPTASPSLPRAITKPSLITPIGVFFKMPTEEEQNRINKNILENKAITLRAKADKHLRSAAKFQEIFDKDDFKADPNSYLDRIFNDSKNYNKLQFMSNKVIGYMTKIRLNISESKFKVGMVKRAIEGLHMQAEMKRNISLKIEEVFNNVEFQANPKTYISNWTKNQYLTQCQEDYFVICDTINLFRKTYGIDDDFGQGAIGFGMP